MRFRFLSVMSMALALVLVLVTALTACGPIDSMKEGFAHSQAVSARLEKTLGMKSFVGFNWNNGTLTSVSVTFQEVPSVPLSDIVQQSKQAIAAEFEQVPAQVVISFALKT